MKLKVEPKSLPEGALCLDVTGEVDMDSSPELERELKDAIKKKPRRLDVRLFDVRYIDSSGIAVLIQAERLCRNKIPLRLVDLSPSVKGVIELAKLATFFQIGDSRVP